jgi:tetratricopeptide (TPR) repeat protein
MMCDSNGISILANGQSWTAREAAQLQAGGECGTANFRATSNTLQNHSLLTLLPGAGTQLVHMHPVAHGWVKSSVFEQDSATYQSAAILLLGLGSRWGYTPASQYLVSHITKMSSLWDELDVNNAAAFGLVLDQGGLYEDALRLRERVVKEVRSQWGKGSVIDGTSLWYLALTYRNMGRMREAAELQEEVLKLMENVQGKKNPDTIMASNNLALTYRELGRLKEAVVLEEEALKLSKEVLGEKHLHTIIASNNLSGTYRALGRLEEAEMQLEEVLKLRKEVLGDVHPATLSASNNLALTYRDLGRLKEVVVLLEDVVKLRKNVLGMAHPDTAAASHNLALIYRDLGRIRKTSEN